MFTSRLPKSTSARRPSAPRDATTSYLPVSVRKPPLDLFAPTPKPERNYLAGYNTSSKKSITSKTAEKNYPSKPSMGHDDQIKMFRTLTDFLEARGSELPIPDERKFFSSISSSEVARIFDYLLGFMIPGFKINKLEIDIIEALTLYKYPYIKSITKSTLVSATTRTAIGSLLMAYSWLVEQIQCFYTDVEVESDGPLETQLADCILYHPDKVDEFLKKLSMPDSSSNDIESAENEHKELDAEIGRLEDELKYHEELADQLRILDEDEKKCKDYIAAMQVQKNRKMEETESMRIESEKIERQIREGKKVLEDRRAVPMEEGKQYDELSLQNLKMLYESEERRIADEKRDAAAFTSKLEQEVKKEEEDLHVMAEEQNHKIDRLTNLVEIENAKLADKEALHERLRMKKLELFKAKLEKRRQEGERIANERERDHQIWIETRDVLREKERSVKAICKQLKKRAAK